MIDATFTTLDKQNEGKQFIAILSKIFENPDETLLISWKKYLESNQDKFIWVVKVEAKIIGIAITHEWEVLPKPNKFQRKYWQLANFFLEKDYRNSGLGVRFLAFILDNAKEHNVEKIMTFAGGPFGEFFIQNGFSEENTLLLKKL